VTAELNQISVKPIISAFVLLLLGSSYNGLSQNTDRDLVYAAIEDYVDGLYLVQPERIRKSVHPNLSKKGYWRKSDNESYGPEQTMTYQQLYDLAGKWNSNGRLPKDAPRKIEIFDVQDQTASAKLTAEWGTDYFQLAKYDGKWMIVNVLWQSTPVSPVAGK
jgi:hypothetical protein